NAELMFIDRRNFIPLIRDNPEVAERLIKVLCARIRKTSEQVEDIVFLGLPNRLAKVLLHLYRPTADAAPSRKINVTQREISQMIGVSRESANKQLQDWQRKKWLKLERGGGVIFAPQALQDLLSKSTEKARYQAQTKVSGRATSSNRFRSASVPPPHATPPAKIIKAGPKKETHNTRTPQPDA